MVVLVSVKKDEDPIKIKIESAAVVTLLHINFSNTQRQQNLYFPFGPLRSARVFTEIRNS